MEFTYKPPSLVVRTDDKFTTAPYISRVNPGQPSVNPYDESVSTKTKGKEMELLLITLAFSVVAVVAQLGDVATTKFGPQSA